MTETQTQNQAQVQLQYLGEEELKRIVEKAVKEGKEEAKMILILERWQRQGPSFVDEQTIEVVHGEVEEVVLEEFDEGYPYRKGEKVALIPRTVPVVVLVERYDNTVSPEVSEKWIYVFTKEGWKRLRVQ